MLCVACKKKLDRGEITESDVNISRMINEIAKTFRPLDDVTVKKVIDSDSIAVVVCNQGDCARLIGKDGAMIKKLSRLAKKSMRVVEESDDIKKFIQNLLYPVHVLGLNTIYKPEGEILKVIIQKGNRIPISKKSFAEIINLVFGKESIIENE